MNCAPCVVCRRAFVRRFFTFALVVSIAATTVYAGSPTTELAPPSCTGSLSQEQGVNVLRLWGTPREQGHAHGKLFGRQISAMLRLILDGDLLFNNPQKYEVGVRKQLLPSFELTDAERAEIAGMLAGMREAVGDEGLMLERLGRPIDETDLIALNTLADWIPGGCSSFAAWGAMTPDGGTVMGRNLDYLDLPGLRELHVVIARKANLEDASSWVSVAWPGLIGAYSAMNEHGVVVAMHDVYAASSMSQVRRRPRSLVLRQIVETTDAANAIQVAERILMASPGTRGNNFMVATKASKDAQAAVVFEYDGNMDMSKGVTVRQAVTNTEGKPETFIACTNHYRDRANADDSCPRYRGIMEKLNASGMTIDSDKAWTIMKGASMNDTIHSMVAFPNTGILELRFATPEENASKQPLKRFAVAKLLE
ncbi:MAG: hypothetical protein KDA54_06600 [Phycisphaerales bacterium]|nr:hypothetical protein [Phycisphaerales bacterium]